jgi:hypothetical protein
MKANVNIAYVADLIKRLDALVAQVLAIPGDPVETPQYKEMLKVLEELRKAMYGE